MNRHLLYVLTTLALLLLVAALVLWVRSYPAVTIVVAASPGGNAWALRSERGELRFRFLSYPRGFPDTPRLSWADASGGDEVGPVFSYSLRFPRSEWSRLGLRWSSGVGWTALRADTRALWIGPGGADPRRLESSRLRSWELAVPWWMAATLSALPAAALSGFALWRLRRQRRMRLGLCPSCGYDLRASRGRCPECGTMAPVPLRS